MQLTGLLLRVRGLYLLSLGRIGMVSLSSMDFLPEIRGTTGAHVQGSFLDVAACVQKTKCKLLVLFGPVFSRGSSAHEPHFYQILI